VTPGTCPRHRRSSTRSRRHGGTGLTPWMQVWSAFFPGQLPDMPVVPAPLSGTSIPIGDRVATVVPVGATDTELSSVVIYAPQVRHIACCGCLTNGRDQLLGLAHRRSLSSCHPCSYPKTQQSRRRTHRSDQLRLSVLSRRTKINSLDPALTRVCPPHATPPLLALLHPPIKLPSLDHVAISTSIGGLTSRRSASLYWLGSRSIRPSLD
jgi:hypothetical protein